MHICNFTLFVSEFTVAQVDLFRFESIFFKEKGRSHCSWSLFRIKNFFNVGFFLRSTRIRRSAQRETIQSSTQSFVINKFNSFSLYGNSGSARIDHFWVGGCAGWRGAILDQSFGGLRTDNADFGGNFPYDCGDGSRTEMDTANRWISWFH